MGNEWSNKKEKKNRSVKVHGGEVKQPPFQKQTKECVWGGGGGGGGMEALWMRERGRDRRR